MLNLLFWSNFRILQTNFRPLWSLRVIDLTLSSTDVFIALFGQPNTLEWVDVRSVREDCSRHKIALNCESFFCFTVSFLIPRYFSNYFYAKWILRSHFFSSLYPSVRMWRNFPQVNFLVNYKCDASYDHFFLLSVLVFYTLGLAHEPKWTENGLEVGRKWALPP